MGMKNFKLGKDVVLSFPLVLTTKAPRLRIFVQLKGSFENYDGSKRYPLNSIGVYDIDSKTFGFPYDFEVGILQKIFSEME
jgi:hypothetical protein